MTLDGKTAGRKRPAAFPDKYDFLPLQFEHHQHTTFRAGVDHALANLAEEGGRPLAAAGDNRKVLLAVNG